MAQAAYPGATWAMSLHPYLALLRVGFTLPLMLPPARCALTAPFHPYQPGWRYIFCGTFHRLAPPRRYLALCPVGARTFLQYLHTGDCLADFHLLFYRIVSLCAALLCRVTTTPAHTGYFSFCRLVRHRVGRHP